MEDSIEAAKTLLEGGRDRLIEAADRLGRAFADGAEEAEIFWRAVFRDYCALVDALPERDNELQGFRDFAEEIAWGATPCVDDGPGDIPEQAVQDMEKDRSCMPFCADGPWNMTPREMAEAICSGRRDLLEEAVRKMDEDHSCMPFCADMFFELVILMEELVWPDTCQDNPVYRQALLNAGLFPDGDDYDDE